MAPRNRQPPAVASPSPEPSLAGDLLEPALPLLYEVYNCAINAGWAARLFKKFCDPRITKTEDWVVVLRLMIAWLNFEAKTYFKDGPHILPHNVPSIKRWLGRREAAVAVDPASELEEFFGDEVAHIWARSRRSSADMVALMHGEGGLSVLVRALLQWRAVDLDAADWATIVTDVTVALDLLREQPVETPFNMTIESLLIQHDAERAAEAHALISPRSNARMGRYRCARKAAKAAAKAAAEAAAAAKAAQSGKRKSGGRLRKQRN